MTEWEGLTDEECVDALGFLREKARQYGFHEIDEVLGLEADLAETSGDALTHYRLGFADYLRIFFEKSLEATKDAFRQALEPGAELPVLRVVLRNGADREQVMDLEAYRKCWELSAMLGHGLERPGPDKPQNPPTPGIGRG